MAKALVNGQWQTYQPLRDSINKQAKLYRVDVYLTGDVFDGEYTSKKFKTYTAALNYAKRSSRKTEDTIAEIVDIDTSRDLYEDDVCATQQYQGGYLIFDGRRW